MPSAQLDDADQVASGIAEGAVANPVRLFERVEQDQFLLDPGADVGREVLAGESGARGDEVGGCALEDDSAAFIAGAGAEVVRAPSVPAPKKVSASVTDIASTSVISRPPSLYSSTEASNRFPSYSSQVVATPAIIARSV